MLRTPVGTDLRSIFPDYSICCFSASYSATISSNCIFSSSSRCWSPVSEAAAISDEWFPAAGSGSSSAAADGFVQSIQQRLIILLLLIQIGLLLTDMRGCQINDLFQIVQIEHGPFFHQRSVTVPDGIVGNIGF